MAETQAYTHCVLALHHSNSFPVLNLSICNLIRINPHTALSFCIRILGFAAKHPYTDSTTYKIFVKNTDYTSTSRVL